MALLTELKERIARWRSADPYHYECTVCERTFQSDRSKCPDCGGAVERVTGAGGVAAEPHP